MGKYVAFLLLFFPLPSHGQVTLGPITLGKPWPVLPACPKTGLAVPTPQRLGICRDQDVVRNVLFNGTMMQISLLESCQAEQAKCPIERVATVFSAHMCDVALTKLKARFGAPEERSGVEDGVTQIRLSTEYLWARGNGDHIVVHRRYSKSMGDPAPLRGSACQMVADSAEWRGQKRSQSK
jgi:hypothetical protein